MLSSANIFEWLGLVLLFVFSFKVFRSVCRGIYQCIIGPMIGMTVNFKDFGDWAAITGATDGIGKAYAEELAQKGLNIVLLSRNPSKLKEVAEEIEKKYHVKTKTIAADFSKGVEIYDSIRKGLEDLEIGILVNNVGISYAYPEYLSMVPDGDNVVHNILNANCLACTLMTRMVIGDMEMRRKGLIVNVASLSALSVTPLLTVYSASKVYMDFLSKGLQAEYRDKGILVQSVLPGFVCSKMSKMSRSSLMVPMPTQYVRWALSTVGIEDRTYGYPAHKLMGYFTEALLLYLPSVILETVNFNVTKGLRHGYYKKHGLLNSPSHSKKME